MFDWQSIVQTGAVLGGITAIVVFAKKVYTDVKRVDNLFAHQETQDSEIKTVKEEQTLIIYGLLACLKGLSEQGCNGPVTEAINKIEKYINQKAHEVHE